MNSWQSLGKEAVCLTHSVRLGIVLRYDEEFAINFSMTRRNCCWLLLH